MTFRVVAVANARNHWYEVQVRGWFTCWWWTNAASWFYLGYRFETAAEADHELQAWLDRRVVKKAPL